MSCCNNYIGKFPHNEDIDTGIIANATGTFVFKFDYLGAGFEIEVQGVDGESLVLETAGLLNENFTYRFKIIDPNGDCMELDDCPDFSFKTYVKLIPCQDDCDINVYL